MRRLFLLSIVAFAVALTAPITARATVAATAVLPSGEGLAPGDRLTTNETRLVMQPDGDLVFSSRTPDGWREVWASETEGNPGAYAMMQEDGNFVVYSPAGAALWHTATFEHPGSYLQLEDRKRRLVLYDADGIDLWVNGRPSGPPPSALHGLDPGDTMSGGQTITSVNGRLTLRLAPSGNITLISRRGPFRRRIWSSETSGNEGARLVMQEDGNLVLYAIGGTPVWNSGTVGNAGAHLRLLNKEKAVIFSKDGRVLWSNGRLINASGNK